MDQYTTWKGFSKKKSGSIEEALLKYTPRVEPAQNELYLGGLHLSEIGIAGHVVHQHKQKEHHILTIDST